MIKYLGQLIPVSQVIDIKGLNEEEILILIKKFYTKKSKEITETRSKYYGEILKLKPKSIEIVKVGGRWGSCDSSRKITYNYLISSLSPDLIDYIIVHELCHLIHMNHDRSFFRKVGSIIPDYKKRQKDIDEMGLDIM